MSTFRLILALLVFICLSFFLFTWVKLRSKLNFHAAGVEIELPTGWQATTQYVQTADGLKIAYWYFPVADPQAVVILIHGYDNPGGKSQMLGHAKYLHDAGYSTVLLDLRSFGESQGSHINMGVIEWQDVAAVYDHIKSLPENSQLKVGYLGVSMGATTALVTAGKTGKGDFVIASVPYSDFSSIYHFQISASGLPPTLFYPFMRLAGALELGFDYEQQTPLAVIDKIHVPLLFISASQDKDVDNRDAIKLYNQANSPKQLWVAEAPHDVFDALPQEFSRRVLDFLSQL